MKIADVEKVTKLTAEYRSLELALDYLRRALAHDARIHALLAQDDAESERSITLLFTKEESAAIFEVAQKRLQTRFETVKAALGTL